MAARPCAHRLSMECVRLCPDRTIGAGANGVADRPVGPDIFGGGDLRKPGRVDRWPFARAQTMDLACYRRAGADRDGNFRRRSLEPETNRDGSKRQAANHAAQSPAGCQIQLLRQGGGDAKISDLVRPRIRAAVNRRTRRQYTDLAGIGVTVLTYART